MSIYHFFAFNYRLSCRGLEISRDFLSDKAKAPEGALHLQSEDGRGIVNNSLLPSPLFVHYVHSNFKAKTHFSSSWFSPHNVSPDLQNVRDVHYE